MHRCTNCNTVGWVMIFMCAGSLRVYEFIYLELNGRSYPENGGSWSDCSTHGHLMHFGCRMNHEAILITSDYYY